MHVLIVHTHPEPKSFNGQLTAAARASLSSAGHRVTVSDLHCEGFDPLEVARHYPDLSNTDMFVPLAEQRHASECGALPPDVRREIERLEAADLVILQFPLWWHGPPAMLKGWFDRVFLSGKLYSSRMRYDSGYFSGKRAVISVTTGAPAAAFGSGARGGNMKTMLWPIQYSLHYLGFSVLPPQHHFGISGHGYSYDDEAGKQRRLRSYIDDWSVRVKGLPGEQPLDFPHWADWDDDGRAIVRD